MPATLSASPFGSRRACRSAGLVGPKDEPKRPEPDVDTAGRFDVKIASETLSEARRQVRVTRHAILPDLNAAFTMRYRKRGEAPDLPATLASPSGTTWALSLSAPVRSGGPPKGRLPGCPRSRGGRDSRPRADAGAGTGRDPLLGRLLDRLHKQEAIQREQIEQAASKLAIAEAKFRNGLASNFDFLEAESELRNAQVNLLAAQRDLVPADVSPPERDGPLRRMAEGDLCRGLRGFDVFSLRTAGATLAVTAALVGIAALWLIGPWPSRASRGGEEPNRTWVVKQTDVRSGVWAMGELAASRSVVVKNRLPGADGRILWIVDDGVEVKEGDVLVRLDSSGFEAELARLRAELVEPEGDGRGRTPEPARGGDADRAAERRGSFKGGRREPAQKTLEQGEGPMEEGKLQAELQKAQEEEKRWKGYVEDLTRVQESGRNVAGELKTASEKLSSFARRRRSRESSSKGSRSSSSPPGSRRRASASATRRRSAAGSEEAGRYAVGRADSEIEKARAQAGGPRSQNPGSRTDHRGCRDPGAGRGPRGPPREQHRGARAEGPGRRPGLPGLSASRAARPLDDGGPGARPRAGSGNSPIVEGGRGPRGGGPGRGLSAPS